MMRETTAEVQAHTFVKWTWSLYYKDKKKVNTELVLCEMISHLLGPVARGATGFWAQAQWSPEVRKLPAVSLHTLAQSEAWTLGDGGVIHRQQCPRWPSRAKRGILKVGVVYPLEDVPGLPCGKEGIDRVCWKWEAMLLIAHGKRE